MNIVSSIVITECFEHIIISITPFCDTKTTKIEDRISICEGVTEFLFLPNELYDITHVNFEFTDLTENRINIRFKTNSVDNTVINRYINKDEDVIDIINSKSTIKSIPTFVIKNVIDAYYFVEAEFDKIKSTIDNKYNKLKVTM